jgi:hypothetical protein
MRKFKIQTTKVKFSRLVVLAGVCLSLVFQSCSDEKIVPNPDIRYVKFSEPHRVYYNHPIQLDLNDDGKMDFHFTVGLFMDGQNVDQKFVAVSLEASRIKLNNTLAMPYDSGYTISDINISDPGLWSIDSGELMTVKTNPNQNVTFEGPWVDKPVAYLAVSIRLNDRHYFGWIKLLSDIVTQSMLITEYAINRIAGSPIDAGQIQYVEKEIND